VRSWDTLPGGAILLSLVDCSTQGPSLPWSTLGVALFARVEVPSSYIKMFGHNRPEGDHASWIIDVPDPGCVSTIPHSQANHRNQAGTCTSQ
jgi:hypothetical protein